MKLRRQLRCWLLVDDLLLGPMDADESDESHCFEGTVAVAKTSCQSMGLNVVVGKHAAWRRVLFNIIEAGWWRTAKFDRG